MINDFRTYDYFTFGQNDGYGQPQLSTNPQGQVKISIFTTSQSIQNNINYSNAQYIGFTHAKVNDTYVIEYEGKKLKVLYVNTQGRYTQVYMSEI